MSIWKEFGPLLEELIGQPIPVTWSGWRPGDQRIFVADIRKAERDLGWRPHVGVRDGISQLYDWVLDHRDLLEAYTGQLRIGS
jgi:CDP-paratose 2-epimerase